MSVNPADLGGPYETVIDVGAFRGDFAKACLEHWPECFVVSFEPLEPKPADFNELACTPEGNPRWQWHEVALGEAAGRVTINRNEFIPSSSILPMADLHRQAYPFTKRTEEVEVGIAMLDEFAEVIDYPALLKIDVQGYELLVLKGAIDVLQDYVTAVVLEVSWEPLYHGAPAPAALAQLLSANGFEWKAQVDTMYHPKAPKLLLQSDELWVRA